MQPAYKKKWDFNGSSNLREALKIITPGFSVSSTPVGVGFPAQTSRVSTNMLSVSGQTDAGRLCDQQDEPTLAVHDLGEGRVRGRPELSRLL